ncbi:MAG: PilZ domain-containing protein [Spirochaetales bacterium]|nr:PilZ domain-containing protein [Spirochaetales bacterium]
MENRIEGKKVFFVYPHSVFQENLIQRLVDLEFEMYILKDHEDIYPVLELYPDAVFFLNIDKGLSRNEWEAFVRSLLGLSNGTISLGIFSYEFDRDVAELYLMELALPCGYIQLKQKLDDAANIISKTLIANEVKSRRKYVRYQAGEGSTLKLNASIHGKLCDGIGVDISSAGMAIIFNEQDLNIKKNSLLTDLQLNLSGRRLRVSGVILGFRQESESSRRIFILLFDQKVGSEARSVIRNYVHQQLQQVMIKALANKGKEPV